MSENDDEAGPVSRSKRFLKLAGMTAAVAGNFAGNKIRSALGSADEEARKRLHQVNGERIAQTLGELKGAAMKIGQMASIGSDILPAELSQALTKLQKEAPPMPYEVIARQIESEFGTAPATLFSRFEKRPFAAASIGQVHRATTDDGRDVVVKVQYPGVDTSVDSDLAHLKVALMASGLVDKAHRTALGKVFEEVRARLHEELDYCNEADNVRKFRQFHAKHAESVVVPDVVGERSSKRVLTLTYEPSDALIDLDKLGYDQPTRDRIGHNLFTILAAQIFDLRAIHADPNPANYGFRRDGRVVLYDYGCVKEVTPEFLRDYKALICASFDEDYAAVERYMLALGARNPAGPPVEAEYYASWRDILLEPLLGESPYDFGASQIHDKVMKNTAGVMKRLASFQPPVDLVFVDRAVAGNFGNLRKLRARAQFRPALEAYIRA